MSSLSHILAHSRNANHGPSRGHIVPPSESNGCFHGLRQTRRLGQLQAACAKKISQNEPNPISGHLPETEQQ